MRRAELRCPHRRADHDKASLDDREAEIGSVRCCSGITLRTAIRVEDAALYAVQLEAQLRLQQRNVVCGEGLQVVSDSNSEVVVGPRRDGDMRVLLEELAGDQLPHSAAEGPHSQWAAGVNTHSGGENPVLLRLPGRRGEGVRGAAPVHGLQHPDQLRGVLADDCTHRLALDGGEGLPDIPLNSKAWARHSPRERRRRLGVNEGLDEEARSGRAATCALCALRRAKEAGMGLGILGRGLLDINRPRQAVHGICHRQRADSRRFESVPLLGNDLTSIDTERGVLGQREEAAPHRLNKGEQAVSQHPRLISFILDHDEELGHAHVINAAAFAVVLLAEGGIQSPAQLVAGGSRRGLEGNGRDNRHRVVRATGKKVLGNNFAH